MCDCSVFAAAVLLTALQTAAAPQSVSELIQNGFKFSLRRHHERCKTQTTRQSFSVGTFWRLHLLDQLCNSVVY
jgi:hypothetical protein